MDREQAVQLAMSWDCRYRLSGQFPMFRGWIALVCVLSLVVSATAGTAVSIQVQASNGIDDPGVAGAVADIPSNSLLQLIYTEDEVAVSVNGLNPFLPPDGDVILTNVVTESAGSFVLGPYTFDPGDDTYVGGSVYVRIFSAPSPSSGDWCRVSEVYCAGAHKLRDWRTPTVVDVSATNLVALDSLLVQVAADDDRDGLPDWWELSHTNKSSVLTSEGDADGDGLTDRQECLLQWDPLGTAPGWWVARAVVTGGSQNDYAPANQGQVKWAATNAYESLKSSPRSGPPLSTIESQVLDTFTSSDDYVAVNIGQAKAAAKPYYDWLGARIGSTNYPWVLMGPASSTNDYAPATVGQVKMLFSFDPIVE